MWRAGGRREELHVEIRQTFFFVFVKQSQEKKVLSLRAHEIYS